MHPSSSLVNIHLSIEKFLYDRLAMEDMLLLVNKEEVVTRLHEVEEQKKAILWHIAKLVTGNKGELTLHVGGTFNQDLGNNQLLLLVDKVKNLFETSAGIAVYDYNYDPETEELIKVNELAIMLPITTLPVIVEPNGFRTKLVSCVLKFGQVLTT